MYTYTIGLVYWQLLLYGVHVGHSFLNSDVFSAWLVFTFRQNILIINLFKTVLSFKNGYVGINSACRFSGPIWFINLDRAVELYVNYAARLCGEFCYSTYWIHGLISNWISLANTFRKLFRMVTGAHKGQFSKLELSSSPWIFGRWTWPRATFVSSVSTTAHPTKESSYLGIPCLGIVDTDISGHIANIATPGNDDSLDCVVLYNTHISQYILEKKYGFISGWFLNVRRAKRLLEFKEWVLLNYIDENGYFNKKKVLRQKKKVFDVLKNIKEDLTFKVKFDNWFYSLRFYFSKNAGLDNHKEQVDLYDPNYIEKLKYPLERLFFFFSKTSVFLSKTLNYYIIKSSWMIYRYIRKNNMSNKTFKLKFLSGLYYDKYDYGKTRINFLMKRFNKNKIYKTFLKKNRYRFNKFILKFVKFYYIKKFSYFRGFIDKFSSNFITVSSFAHISMSYCSFLFLNNILTPLFKYSNSFLNKYNLKKVNFLVKWGFFKKGISLYLKKILNNNKINNYLKFFLSFKVYHSLKKIIFKKTRNLFIYFNFFLSFWMWSNIYFKERSEEISSFIYTRWRTLKKIQRNLVYLYFLKESLVSSNKFNILFNNKLNFGNNKLIYYFNILTTKFRQTLFNKINTYYYNNITLMIKSFYYSRRKNLKARKGNRALWLLEHKFGKFKHLKNREQDKYYQPYITNKYLKGLNFPGKKFSTFKYFRRYFKNTSFIKRLNYYLKTKVFLDNSKFNQVSKSIYYNYNLLNNYTFKLSLSEENNVLSKNKIEYFFGHNNYKGLFKLNYSKSLYNYNLIKKYYNFLSIKKRKKVRVFGFFFLQTTLFEKHWYYNKKFMFHPLYFYINYSVHTFNLKNLKNNNLKNIKYNFMINKKSYMYYLYYLRLFSVYFLNFYVYFKEKLIIH